MSLAEKYKEVLKSQGINANIELYKPKKRRDKIAVLVVAVLLILPSYFLVYQNYNSCLISSNLISNNTATNNSFSLKCGTNSILYSIAIAIIIAIILLGILKLLRYRNLGKE